MKKLNLFLFSLIFLFFGNTFLSFSQITYTVTKVTDPNPYSSQYNYVDSLCDTTMYGTLQWAIRKSNDDTVPSIIEFNIPGPPPHIIMLNYALPTIKTSDLTIDGTSQPDYNGGEPTIIIDGQNKLERGLYFYYNSNYIVQGLWIRNFLIRGILFQYAQNILVGNNVITGISNNNPDRSATAIRLIGNPKTGLTNAQIRANYIGTNYSLDTTIGCDDAGILIGKNANNNIIGGNNTYDGNIIAYNHNAGIYITSAQKNKISRNIIFSQNTAIKLVEGANNNKPAPTQLAYDTLTHIFSGKSEPYDTIEIFNGTPPENVYQFVKTTYADDNGDWGTYIEYPGNYLFASATKNGNTSKLLIGIGVGIGTPVFIVWPQVTASGLCNCSGTATAIPIGGHPPYSYQWDDPNHQTTQTAYNLCPFQTYHVTVTASNGAIGHTVVTIPSNPNVIYVTATNITSSVTWNSLTPYYLDHYLFIEPGSDLTITHTNVLSTSSGRLIVKREGQLAINDFSVLKNACPFAWRGIQLEGFYNWPQDNSSAHVSINKSRIKNALYGIFAIGDAIVHVNNSDFVNNDKDIVFWSYWYNNSGNQSTLIKNTFRTNYNFFIPYFGNVIYEHIWINHSRFYSSNNIYGNVFINETNSPNFRKQAGIMIANSSALINKNDFKGLYYGIYNHGYISTTFRCYDNTFEENNYNIGNLHGVYVGGSSIITDIHDNIFKTYNTFMPTPTPSYPYAYGIYLYAPEWSIIRDNDFTNGYIGVYTANTGNTYIPTINDNTFYVLEDPIYHHPSAGIIGIGENNTNMFCNYYEDVDYDMVTIDGTFNSIQATWISNIQGSTKNHLNHNDANCINGDNAISLQNPPTGNFPNYHMNYYVSYSGAPDDPQSCVTNPNAPANQLGVSLQINDNGHICHNYSFRSIAGYQQLIDSLKTVIYLKKDTLSQLVDNGNTLELLNEVNNLTPRNYFQIAADLYNATPYLSDTVLLSFMRNPLHRPVAKTVVLLANSPLPLKGKQEIDNTNLPPPFKYLLWQYQDGTNPREQKEYEIKTIENYKDMEMNNLIVYGTTDTLPLVKDSLLTFLSNDEDYRSHIVLITQLIANGNYSEAMQFMNNLDDETNNLPINQKQIITDFIDLQNIVIQLEQGQDSLYQDSVISANSNLLFAIAGNDLHPYNIDARLMLSQIGLDSIVEPTPLPDPMANKRLEITPTEEKPDYAQIDWSQFLEIYPNPTNNELSVEYLLLDKGQYQLAIFDLKGKLLVSKPVTEPFGLVKLNTTGLPQGSYIVSVTNGNQPSKISKQFTVVH